MHIQGFIDNTKRLMTLAYPILIAQLIQTLMGFADTVMAGRVSSTDMAAIAVASSIWLPIILTISGVVMALAAIVSQLSGANDYKKIGAATQQTAWISFFMSVALIALYYGVAPYIQANVSLEPQLQQLLFDYLEYVVWGGPGFCLYLVFRNYSEGLSHTRPTMIVSIVGLIINIPANYIFIYGYGDIPALGGAGCGIATAIVYWVMCISMYLYCIFSKHLKHAPIFDKLYLPNWHEIKYILLLGVPIALSLLFEVSLFGVVAIILAPFGAETVASHQIVINFSGLIFMIPLSLAMAVTILVGTAIGNKKIEQAKQVCTYSIALGLLIALFTALFTLAFRYQIAEIYSHELVVIELAASLMLLATLFQFSDAIQVIAAGALRGYKDTTAILYLTFVSYWVVGLSVGLVLGITDWIIAPIGPYGFWIGIISGLTTAAILLGWRLKVVQARFATEAKQTS
ncbi:MATE family efflux transporter [Thalassotalea sp. PP2-459]|uniref:MATE family efflux transporter n=1 Tax=Thalassotalea sp. PP2-459 TaxID=1742724 RepID=UPI0009449334|nr:MATE family efflux transporter [Thalassotalea sp. PP2-459]OKY25501.1 MATE family efflux transporter [Thalassotalea sp. PP2-459]